MASLHVVAASAILASGIPTLFKLLTLAAILGLGLLNLLCLAGPNRVSRLKIDAFDRWSIWVDDRCHDAVIPRVSWETPWFTLIAVRKRWRTWWLALDDRSGRDDHRRLRARLRRALR